MKEQQMTQKVNLRVCPHLVYLPEVFGKKIMKSRLVPVRMRILF